MTPTEKKDAINGREHPPQRMRTVEAIRRRIARDNARITRESRRRELILTRQTKRP